VEIKLADFAAAMGVSPQAVRKAIKEGRLVNGVKQGKRGYLIDPDIATKEWKDNTDTSQQRPPEVISRAKLKQPPDGLPSNINYTKARAYAELFKSRLLELEYREKAGQLLRANDVKVAQFNTIRMMRDAIENIPIRIVAEIAAVLQIDDAEQKHEILQILQREIKTVLNNIAESDGIS
tara:strand:- start:5135 stop:5671 length:537 start_codon:yes stop_codon:yes gene_type:complete